MRHALRRAREIPGLTVYGPSLAIRGSPLLAFNVAGTDRCGSPSSSTFSARVPGRLSLRTLAHRNWA
jgi:selenocysteine lyase/cysteine desulfurase